jgi:hypothetical protein
MEKRSFLASFVFLIVSCGTLLSRDPGVPYVVEVVSLVAPAQETSPAGFVLGPQLISSLQNLEHLDGSFVKFYYGGVLKAKEITGSLVSDGRFSGGEKPQLRYRVRDGVVVPLDYQTLVMLSAYRQFDVIAANLKTIYGIDSADMAKAQKNGQGKYEVLFEPRVEIETKEISGTLTMKRNAAFVPGKSQFVLFERSASEKVPLAANLQVLAHEFGHAIFDYTFFDNSFDSNSAYASNYAISGLNEGFADFSSFLMSHSTDVLSGSISMPELVAERNFATSTYTLVKTSTSSGDVGRIYSCTGSFYCVGTLLARSLYTAYSSLGTAEREKFAVSLPTALRAARSALDSSQIPVLQAEDGDDISIKDVDVMRVFLNAFVKSVSTAVYTPAGGAKLCEAIGLNFGFSLHFGDWTCSQ